MFKSWKCKNKLKHFRLCAVGVVHKMFDDYNAN